MERIQIEKQFEFECPDCGQDNKAIVVMKGNSTTANSVFECDPDSGGCEKPFVVVARASVQVETEVSEIKVAS